MKPYYDAPTAVDYLRAYKHVLDEQDEDFAKSLTDQYEKKGKLSYKQWPWVYKLADRCFDKITKPEPKEAPTVEVGSLSGLVSMFQKAKEKLKYPKVVLGLMTGVGMKNVVLDVGGPKATYPGAIRVKMPSIEGEIYCGAVTSDGKFHCGKKWSMWDDATAVDNLVMLLQSLSKDPVGVASAHGHLTGKCCFCNSTLTDEKSTKVGYGPVCAKQYGLPWGANGGVLKPLPGGDKILYSTETVMPMKKFPQFAEHPNSKSVIVGMDFGKTEGVAVAEYVKGAASLTLNMAEFEEQLKQAQKKVSDAMAKQLNEAFTVGAKNGTDLLGGLKALKTSMIENGLVPEETADVTVPSLTVTDAPKRELKVQFEPGRACESLLAELKK